MQSQETLDVQKHVSEVHKQNHCGFDNISGLSNWNYLDEFNFTTSISKRT